MGAGVLVIEPGEAIMGKRRQGGLFPGIMSHMKGGFRAAGRSGSPSCTLLWLRPMIEQSDYSDRLGGSHADGRQPLNL